MTLNFYCEVFLILNTMVTYNFQKIDDKNEKHQVDIIKNISLANIALQELINNYEQLKKMYKSGEILQSDSSFSESNEYFRVSYRNRSYQKFSELNASTLKPATIGIYESQQNYDNSDSTDEVDLIKNVINLSKESEVKINRNKDRTDEDSSDNFGSEDIESISIEIPLKKDTIVMNPKTTTEKSTLKMKTPKTNQNILGEKTRFSVKKFGHQNESDNQLLEIYDINRRRIKKVVHSETFSPNNFWQEIISKPMELTKDIKTNPQFRNYDSEITFILSKDGMKDNNFLNRLDDVDSSIKEKYENQFQDIYLRSRYGGMCLHIPIKRCKKVINEVSKKVCRGRFKCKSDFKSDFIKNGKRGCEKAFMYGTLDNGETKKYKEKDFKMQPYSKNKRDSVLNKREKNYHRENKDKTKTITLRNETPYYINPIALRNKYERECRKELRTKCIKACEYAIEETCSENTCSTKKESAFKKSCKNECNKLFVVRKRSASRSDSDDDSDSDSKSDSDKSDRSDRS